LPEGQQAQGAESQQVKRAAIFTFLLSAFLGLAAAPASATKTHLFAETFGSVEQPTFENTNSLAIDRATGDLLVLDTKAKTVSRFHPDGTPDDFSTLGTNVIDGQGTADKTPQNGFSFFEGFGNQITVDNSGTLTDGNIYITQAQQEAGNLIDVFASSGEYLGQLTGAGLAPFGTNASFPFTPCGVAVDATGNLFVGAGFENKVYKFDPSANPPVNTDLVATYQTDRSVCNLAAGAGPSADSLFATIYLAEGLGDSAFELDATSLSFKGIVDHDEASVLSVDPSTGELYAASATLSANESPINHVIKQLDVTGSGVSLRSTTPLSSPVGGLGVFGSNFYLAMLRDSTVSVYGPLVTVPDVTTGAASITGDTSATVNGTVDPDGVALEECVFEYGPTNSYGQSIPCAESPAEIGTSAKAVHAELSGLAGETFFHYRLAARNLNATIRGADKTFKTPAKPTIKGQWATEVGMAEGTIRAQLNPENSPTTYRFEWGTDASYGSATAEISIGSGEADRTVGRYLDGLASATTYHYRVVATNGIGLTEGPDHSFTTFPIPSEQKTNCPNQAFHTGPSAPLPDCRAYEMVSPVDKDGGEIKVLGSTLNSPARLEVSAADGNRFAYSSVTAFGDALSAPWTSEYISTRKEDEGWSTHAINPARETKSLTLIPAFKWDVQYKAFSPDLASGWLIHDTEPPLDECAPKGNLNLYRRDNTTGGYEALTINPPTDIGKDGYELELQGVSVDERHAVFRANGKLTPDAATKGLNQVYEHVQDPEGGCGELRLASILPNGKASTAEASLGTFDGLPGESRISAVSHAVSADGSRVFWSTVGSGGALYLRDIETVKTVQVASGGPRFWNATPDGSKALYTAGGNLYEFDSAKGLAGELASTLIAEGAKGVAASGEDMSRIYFVSTEVLGGEGEAGEPNLYLREGGGDISLIATLYGGDATLPEGDLGGYPKFGFAVAQSSQLSNGVRTTADGAHLAFVSAESLTGYDNLDASDGRRSLEVYLYDLGADHLACISCNPTGARPTGRLIQSTSGETLRRVSAHMAPGQNMLFTPRALSSDGNRLFFESFEALLARDTNGKGDVYEWQRAESQAQCDEAGAELYVPSSGGCLSLISTGQSPVDSEFADASPDGKDVFIRTSSSLLPQDSGQVDVYDARIGGGLPQPPPPPAACEGEACQGPLAPPNDPTPASSAFEGAGNVAQPAASCRKPKVRRKGRCVAKKARKEHGKTKRTHQAKK
jgi:hypothetical protein